jgi:hypothetical protein
VEIDGRAFEITTSGARGISSRVRQREHFNALVYDARGVLWLIDGDTVKYLWPDSQWQALPADAFAGEPLKHLKANRLGAIDVLTDRSVRRIHPDSAPHWLFSGSFSFDVVSLEDGRTIVLIPGAFSRCWWIAKAVSGSARTSWDFFKRNGSGYQARMNAVLRA